MLATFSRRQIRWQAAKQTKEEEKDGDGQEWVDGGITNQQSTTEWRDRRENGGAKMKEKESLDRHQK
ncbi:hypothetical protein OUZ56_025292 [Daphnia magna]|uniref:Uncharacterized protein n=1 Tax=Daphnia magna TaxID=35525 RepID=A0ABQ9ZJE3_9CRUS|nr:hypothetical protein OUZ56_025292 [Daphnia magna]